MSLVSQHAASWPQGLRSTETLLFFLQYFSFYAISKWVLHILVVFQTVDFCCILTVVILLTIMIDLLKSSALQANVALNIMNLQSVLIIVIMSFVLLSLWIVLWKCSIQSQPATRFCLFATMILDLSIILWSLILFVLLVREKDWDVTLEKKQLYRTYVMQVCLSYSLHSQQVFLLTYSQKESLACACMIVYLKVLGLVICWAYTTSLLIEKYRRMF